jgi:hypothetical protein
LTIDMLGIDLIANDQNNKKEAERDERSASI